MIKFEKYHGLGNDFIIFNYKELMEKGIDENEFSNLAIAVCDRHTGIGADGMMILVEKEDRCQMIFINADGSVGAMCGNGIRCFANYIYNNNLLEGTTYKVETLAGLMTLDIESDGEFQVKVNMGKPSFDTKSIGMTVEKDSFLDEIIEVDGKKIKCSVVLMGVPHLIIFVDDIGEIEVEKVGAKIEHHPIFTHGTNVNFVQILEKNEISIETWERGAGHTLACGTGSCASVVVGEKLGYLDKKVEVHLQLGELKISVDEEVFMTGPAKLIARGEYKYN